jgi:alanine dehydrogenase
MMGKGLVQMPSKVYVTAGGGSDFRAMPALLGKGAASTAGIKWVSVFPGNRQKGLPTVNGTIFLSSAHNGRLLAILEANTITALRTGAAAAVAAKYLAKRGSKTLALVGAGLQAEYQLKALASLYHFSEIKVWGYLPGEAGRFCDRFNKNFRKIRPTSDVRTCVKDADIVVTCTPSRRPLVFKEWIKPGCHINAIGADAKGKEELEPALLKKAKVVVDEWEQASHSGEINVPVSEGIFSKRNLYADLASIVVKHKAGRRTDKEITIFDSTGLATLDIHFAHHVYKKLA